MAEIPKSSPKIEESKFLKLNESEIKWLDWDKNKFDEKDLDEVKNKFSKFIEKFWEQIWWNNDFSKKTWEFYDKLDKITIVEGSLKKLIKLISWLKEDLKVESKKEGKKEKEKSKPETEWDKIIAKVMENQEFQENDKFKKIREWFAELNKKDSGPMEYVSFVMSNLWEVVSMVFDKLWWSLSWWKLKEWFWHLKGLEGEIDKLKMPGDKEELKKMKENFEEKIEKWNDRNHKDWLLTVNDEADLAYLLWRVKDKLNWNWEKNKEKLLRKNLDVWDILVFDWYALKWQEKKSRWSIFDWLKDSVWWIFKNLWSDKQIKESWWYVSKSATQDLWSPWLHTAIVTWKNSDWEIMITHADQLSWNVVEKPLKDYLSRFDGIDIAVTKTKKWDKVAENAKKYLGKPYSVTKMFLSGWTWIDPYKISWDWMFCSEVVLKTLIETTNLTKEEVNKNWWDPKEIFRYTDAKYATSLDLTSKKSEK